jgi:hypothetical protein
VKNQKHGSSKRRNRSAGTTMKEEGKIEKKEKKITKTLPQILFNFMC